MKPEDIELTPEEQEIEDSIDQWVPAGPETRERLRSIAKRSRNETSPPPTQAPS